MKKAFLSILSGGLWIAASEFARNEWLLKGYWMEHYQSLGLNFKTLPVHGMLWMLWSFGLAYVVHQLLEKFSFKQTVFLTWLIAFVMMWIAIYNLQVLPLKTLGLAVPLSLIEVGLAAAIVGKLR